MSVLGINSESFDVTLGDTLEYIGIIVAGFAKNAVDFMDHQRAIDYIGDRKYEIEQKIRALPAGVPSGPAIRKIIYDVLGIWLNVRKDTKLVFQAGSRLSKYYKISEPGDLVPPGGTPGKDFKIESPSGIIYTKVDVYLHYKTVAPHDGYRF